MIKLTEVWPYSFKDAYHSVQFSSVAQLCPTLCDPMNRIKDELFPDALSVKAWVFLYGF